MAKTADHPKQRDALAVAALGCPSGLAGRALQLRVFAPWLFISAPPVPPSKEITLTRPVSQGSMHVFHDQPFLGPFRLNQFQAE
jgi:hypothetical protein